MKIMPEIQKFVILQHLRATRFLNPINCAQIQSTEPTWTIFVDDITSQPIQYRISMHRYIDSFSSLTITLR